jgi:Mycothiol maleylpyruvate isomerase N-terminal domain
MTTSAQAVDGRAIIGRGSIVTTKEDTMGARAEALAKKFEAKAQEAGAVIERLSDADWKKVTSAEKWSVGVVAHHLAGAHEPIAGIIKAVAGGQSMPNFTMEMLHEMNAKHAQEHAHCTKAETVALHAKGVAAAAAVVRGLSDAELDRSGTVLTGMPSMSAEQVASGILLGHIDEHLASIRAAVGA